MVVEALALAALEGTSRCRGAAGTLLGGPIGTGNLYLTNDEANGGVGAGVLSTLWTFWTFWDGCDSRNCDNEPILLGNIKRGMSLSSGVSKRLVRRTGVGI